MCSQIFRGECRAASSLSGSDRSAKTMFLSGKRELKRKRERRDGGRRRKTRGRERGSKQRGGREREREAKRDGEIEK